MPLMTWMKTQIGSGTHTPFRGDTLLGFLANFVTFVVMGVVAVVAGVAIVAGGILVLPALPFMNAWKAYRKRHPKQLGTTRSPASRR